MKNLKFIFTLILAAFCYVHTSAQGILIYKSDDTVIEIPYNELDSIVSNEASVSNIEFVNLGLSVKWANCNVGAESPEEFGDYFAWGEISPKDSYDEDNSVTSGKDMASIAARKEYDAARANWGYPARMPTVFECQELYDKCKWEWTKLNGVVGMKITGPNGNSIFMPAAGARSGKNLFYDSQYGIYWTATPYDTIDDAYSIAFAPDGPFWSNFVGRGGGQTIRPVCQ